MRRRSGCIWIAAGLVLAIVAGVLTYSVLNQAARQAIEIPEEPKTTVVVAARAIGVRDLLQAVDLEVRQAPASIVPEAALRRVSDVVGQIAIVPFARGEMVLSTHIISPTIVGKNIAWTMDEDKVAMAFPADDLMTRNGLLKPGDHVDVLFSLEVVAREEGTGGLVTFNALHNLEIAAIVQPADIATRATGSQESRPLAIVFALDPQDALVLKHLQDRGGDVDLVLRAPGVTERFTTQSVNINHVIDLYQLRIPELP